MATKAKKKEVSPIDQMTLSELQAKRIAIAEAQVTSGIFWEIKDGKYISVLDKTDYQKIKDRIATLTK